MKHFKYLLYLIPIIVATTTDAKVVLPKIFTNNMVLQRDQEVRIWGWSNKKEKVTIQFNGQTVSTVADRSGKWTVKLNPMKYGGPYEMVVSGKDNTIQLENILIGDVWLCSGQSNMEWVLKNTIGAEAEIANSSNPQIRLMTVEKDMAFLPSKDLKGGEWLNCNPETSGDFSAVGYYFGKKISNDLKVPVGLINSSWGGTGIETWMSRDITAQWDQLKNLDQKKYDEETKKSEENRSKYQTALEKDSGIMNKWYDPSTNYDDWMEAEVSKIWEQTEIGDNDGIVWYTLDFELSENQKGKGGVLSLGPIDDADETYINGHLVGSETIWNKPRVYDIRPGILKSGSNRLVIKVTDFGGGGGLYGAPDQMFLQVAGKKVDLSADWKYKPAVLSKEYGVIARGPNDLPSLLYNAMIAPFTDLSIKGVIWYQGENNAGQPFTYRELFPTFIKDWRKQFNNDFPFFWVQLANFMAPDQNPSESQWAELREAQNRTLSVPNTGQAVIIDIGEANDIHPRNKKDVGDRLALSAEKVAYEKDVVHSGPVYESMKVVDNTIELTFSSIGSGLKAIDKYGYLRGFAIAGSDHKFVWAQARIVGNKIVVISDQIKTPQAVRYAWGNNPDDANLYNQEGLPASPFRTDQWNVPVN